MAALSRACASLLAAAYISSAASAEDVARRAADLLRERKPREAIAELRIAIRAYPAYFPAYSLLGVSYSQLGKHEQARPFFEKAVALAPRSLEARINLGANYLALNQPNRAAAEFEKVLAARPDHVNALVNLGNARLRAGNAQDAVRALEKAQALAPDDLEVQLALAETKFRTGHAEEAMAQLGEVAQVEDPGVQLATGLLLERNGQSREARTHFLKFGQVDSAGLLALAEKSVNEGEYALALVLLDAVSPPLSGSAKWHAVKGYSHFKLDQPKAALDHLQQAVRLDPANEDYYLELVEYLGANNAVRAVVVVLESAERALPDSWKIRSALAVAYLMQSDFGKAESVLLGLIRIEPRDEIAQKLLADCYNRSQNWIRLKQVAGTLRKLVPGDAQGWYYGALAEYQLLESSAADASAEALRTYAERAVRLAPQDWRAQILRGKLLLRDSRAAEALAAFRKAVAANPDEPVPHYLLATTLRQLGAAEESRNEFDAFRRAREKESARKFRTLVVEIQRREPASP